MSGVHQKTILARRRAEEIIGRGPELGRIADHAKGASGEGGLFLLAQPGAGASELLLQTFDSLFFEYGEVIPIYFAFDRRDRDPGRASVRFAREFLAQAVAFGRKEPGIVFASPNFDELSKLVSPRDSVWLEDLIESCSLQDPSADTDSLIKACFALPQRAAAAGQRVFVMLDAIHESVYLTESEAFIDAIRWQWNAGFQFILSAHRRFFGRGVDLARILLEAPTQRHAAEIVEKLAAKRGVPLTEEARDLLVAQLQNDPRNIDAVVRRAETKGVALDGFTRVVHAYSDELFSGSMGAHFDGIIDAATPSQEAAQKLISLLYDSISRETPLLPIAKWQKRLNLDATEFERLLNVLNVEELIRVTSNRVEVMRGNLAFCDFIRARFRLELGGEDRARVFADELAGYAKRAPELMARGYRRASAIDLRELMSGFQRRSVPVALLDYATFKENYKGLAANEIVTSLHRDRDHIELPAIIFTAHTESFYPQLAAHIDTERSAVGMGFTKGTYSEQDETVWICAEIDSKLEASKELAEFWCDRLEAAALMCDFQNYRIWLIAPEGFTSEALEAIALRTGLGSSRRQAELLREFLRNPEQRVPEESRGEEYEITIPIGGDAELVAAHTLEDIARKHGFKSGDVNQIKTAVVEACINASEHSLSPDGQIRLSFHLTEQRMTITVANRGLRLLDHMPQEDSESEARRGWGLKLMERLMDDVRVEQTDDGTRISMSKFLEAA